MTRATALVAFKIANLSAHISDLRRMGYKITSVTEDDGSGTGQTYTRWTYQGRKRGARPPRA